MASFNNRGVLTNDRPHFRCLECVEQGHDVWREGGMARAQIHIHDEHDNNVFTEYEMRGQLTQIPYNPARRGAF